MSYPFPPKNEPQTPKAEIDGEMRERLDHVLQFALYKALVRKAPYQICSRIMGAAAKSQLDLPQIVYGDEHNETLQDWKEGLVHPAECAFADFHHIVANKPKEQMVEKDKKNWYMA